MDDEGLKNVPVKKEAGKKKLFQAIIALILAYFTISAALGGLFGIKLPQPPLYKDHPSTVILSNPSYKKPYNRNIDTKELQKIIDNHPYDQPYKAKVFDCSDMSKELARYLQEEKGYDTSVIGDDTIKHGWVYVWTGKNEAWAIEVTEEAALARGSAGEILGDDWWDYFWSLKNLLDLRTWSNGGPAEFYYPTVLREKLHVFEWSEITKKM